MPDDDDAAAAMRYGDHPDAHGQAALLLVESLIHGLIERSVLTTADAVEVVETAMDVQADVAEASDGAGRRMWRSYSLLADIATSLKKDLPGSDGEGVALAP